MILHASMNIVAVRLTILHACHLHYFVITDCSLPSTGQQLPTVERYRPAYHNCDRRDAIFDNCDHVRLGWSVITGG